SKSSAGSASGAVEAVISAKSAEFRNGAVLAMKAANRWVAHRRGRPLGNKESVNVKQVGKADHGLQCHIVEMLSSRILSARANDLGSPPRGDGSYRLRAEISTPGH